MTNMKKPKVAYIVYNDVYRDSRVLKTADSAARAGADVRLIAFGGPLSHYPAGTSYRASGAEIVRLSLFPDNVPVLSGVIAWRRRRLSEAAARRQSVPAAPGGARKSSWLKRLRRRIEQGLGRFVIRVRAVDFRRRAARALLDWKPDIVHAHDANTLEVAETVHDRAGIPFVYDAHELWEMRNATRSERDRARDRRMLDRVTSKMAGSVTVSPGIQRWMQERYALAEMPTLVRNVPPRAEEPPARENGRLREMAGLSADDKVIVYVGRITSGRGLPETIDALDRLPEDIHLVLLGYGPDAFVNELRGMIARANLEDRTHFVGSVDSADVPFAIADADLSIVYTQPINLSYTFSLPNKLFESIHAGHAIVASDLPDVVALVEEHGVGETFPSGDVDALAAAIDKVLADPHAFREASRAAARELTWENEMARLFALYAAVTGDRINLGR